MVFKNNSFTVSFAFPKNARWCTAKEHNFCDQPRSKNENNLYWTERAFILFTLCFFPFIFMIFELIHWWIKPNRKRLQANDTFIWIVINVFMGAMSYWFLPCTICVNTQISKAVMSTAFESVHCSHTFYISCTIMLPVKILQHSFPYFIKTVGIHNKLAIRYSSIQAHKILLQWLHIPSIFSI